MGPFTDDALTEADPMAAADSDSKGRKLTSGAWLGEAAQQEFKRRLFPEHNVSTSWRSDFARHVRKPPVVIYSSYVSIPHPSRTHSGPLLRLKAGQATPDEVQLRLVSKRPLVMI